MRTLLLYTLTLWALGGLVIGGRLLADATARCLSSRRLRRRLHQTYVEMLRTRGACPGRLSVDARGRLVRCRSTDTLEEAGDEVD